MSPQESASLGLSDPLRDLRGSPSHSHRLWHPTGRIHVYRLEFSSASGKTTSFDEQRVLRIGRSSENDIVLDSPSVSRRHGELRPTPTGWDLVDIGSTGGTWVDNQRVSHVSLGATTTVRFGTVGDGVSAFITVAMPHASFDGPPD